ncbi:hypothetical protein [Leptospira jelokensis]|uniref:Uncharacterized protein n=1 Tax=Leptospira jelokensis TaxID=2484931 RepID=A0A4Z1A5R1_9LEPT|nr:hypothetical protein [Leptospira jelokensis]TGL65281.1 hypothetical protein EHQ62_11935 [Leptospira jelokensis]
MNQVRLTKWNRQYPIILFFFVHCMLSKYQGDIPRLDEKSHNQSIQIIKIAEQIRFSHYQTVGGEERMVYTQEDLIKGIQSYKEQYSDSKPKWEYANLEQYQFEKKNMDPEKLDAVIKFLKKEKEPYVFTSHRKIQYDWGTVDWKDKNENLILSKFYGQYFDNDWSPYAFLINLIPNQIVGIGIFRFQINEQVVEFRANARKTIWRFPFRYWAHTHIFSTKNGKNKFPILVQISDPNDRDKSQNGLYFIYIK